VKTRKQWKPQTIRQTVACARLFFTEMLGHAEWKCFPRFARGIMRSCLSCSPAIRFIGF
jgi:hypothetical protein